MNRKTKRTIGLVLVLAYWLYIVLFLATTRQNQWDFKTYYYAAKVHAAGGNQYDLSAVNEIAPEKITLLYVYPPLTIYFFRIFACFDWHTALELWLWLKVLLAVGLVFIWRRYFYAGGSLAVFLLFALFAYNSAVYWDLIAGNISIVEQLLLWLGFLFFMKKRSLLFALFIVLASLFKFTNLGFLVLIIGLPREDRPKATVVGAGSALAYAVVSYLINPQRFKEFVTVVRSIKEGGEQYNHSLLACLHDAVDSSGLASTPEWAIMTVYFLLAVGIIAVSVHFWRKYGKGYDNGGLFALFLTCVVYAVVAPRMKTYSYILLLVPSFYVIKECAKMEALIFLFILMSLTKWTPLPNVLAVRLLWWQYPWLLAVMIWVLMLRQLRNNAKVTAIATSSA